jgi:hypothetical protein
MLRIGFTLCSLAVTMGAGAAPALAQFGEVPTDQQVKADDALKDLRKRCRSNEGAACYEIGMMMSRGQLAGLNSSNVTQWTLFAEACEKQYAPGCAATRQKAVDDSVAAVRAAEEAQQRAFAERRRKEEEERLASARREQQAAEARLAAEEAQRRYLAAKAQREAGEANPQTEEEAPEPKKSGGGGLLEGLALVGSGLASGLAAGPDASDADRQAAVASGMTMAAQLMGDDEAVEGIQRAAQQQGVSSGLTSPGFAAAATASPSAGGSGSGFNGQWAYTGRYAAQVRHFLTQLPNWRCPTGPGDGGVTPRLPVRPSSQRDQYVAAAVTTAWGLECYAREGKFDQAREWEPTMGDALENANALCSSATAAPGRSSPATLGLWGCPPPIR